MYCEICGYEIHGQPTYIGHRPVHQACYAKTFRTCDKCMSSYYVGHMNEIGTGKYICDECLNTGTTTGEKIAEIFRDKFGGSTFNNDGRMFDSVVHYMEQSGERDVERAFVAVVYKHREIMDAVIKRHKASQESFLDKLVWGIGRLLRF